MTRLPGRSVLLAIALGALSAGCQTMAEPRVPGDATLLQTQAVPSEVAQYLYTGVPDRRRLLVSGAEAWSDLWAEATAIYQPPPAVPQIDFGTEAVVIASMGTRPSGGYSIAIESVHEADGQIYVTVLETSPGRNCIVTAALTAPVHAVRIPRRNATVVFIERDERRDC